MGGVVVVVVVVDVAAGSPANGCGATGYWVAVVGRVAVRRMLRGGGSSISQEVRKKAASNASDERNFIGVYDGCASVLIQCASGDNG